ncbi:MAG: putative structural protein [Caudoviricetes sp.]|nr:MAG: putative structural protein [Caudoviricetes sp.]
MSDETLPTDLGDTGKELIAKFRAENARLTAQLQKFEGIDPAQYKLMSEQSQTLQQQNQALSQKIQTADAQWEFYQKASGKIDPLYIQSAWKLNSDQLKVTDAGFQIGDKPIADAINNFLAEYPKFAAVSEGSNLPRDTEPKQDAPAIISPENFMDNLDDIASGKVRIN